MEEPMTVYSIALLLFLVIDPIGNIPLFLSILKKYDLKTRRRIILRELIIALLFLLLYLFTGHYLQVLLDISEASLTVAGGIILFLISLRMVFPRADTSFAEQVEGEPFIVPLAVPFIAGPTSLATISFIMTRDPKRWPEWLLAILLAWLASTIILYFSSSLSRLLGTRGIIALERLMGLILVVIAVQMFMNGIREFLRTL